MSDTLLTTAMSNPNGEDRRVWLSRCDDSGGQVREGLGFPEGYLLWGLGGAGMRMGADSV